jgi:hypothetical protein
MSAKLYDAILKKEKEAQAKAIMGIPNDQPLPRSKADDCQDQNGKDSQE